MWEGGIVIKFKENYTIFLMYHCGSVRIRMDPHKIER
jgi:hypothetical protein